MADNVIVRVPEQQFIRGEDGYSPEVTIEDITHGHSVNITDRDHPTGQSFNVLDGDSAYEQAVAGGYTGTEAQFNEELASFKELSDEAKDAAPFYAEYGVTTKAEIETAINGKRQIYVHSALGMDYAPLVGTFLYLPMFGNVPQTGYRFATIEGTTQYIYDLRDEWSTSENDLSAPADRAEQAAAQALIRMNSADASAQDAEAYAVGKRKGIDVGAGDPAYLNNSKYYAEQASTAATTATTKAGEASDSATAADGSAKDAEAYAIGKRNGTDVGSTDPAYHNNAKYYAEQASGSATAASGSATSAASSATAAGNAQTAAETAQGKAEDAQEAAEAVLASIPSDYTELTEDVDDLKSAFESIIIEEGQIYA